MKRPVFFIVCLVVFLYTAFISLDGIDPERQWSQFRGHLSSGVLDGANLPETWDVKSNDNILWNIEIPGLGLSSPVVWSEQLFITTAISAADKDGLKKGIYGDIESVEDESEHEWKLYCINKRTGKILWDRVSIRGIPEQKRHPKSSHANCSAATDGTYVIAFYGSEGLYCYDMEGKLMWEKDFDYISYFVIEGFSDEIDPQRRQQYENDIELIFQNETTEEVTKRWIIERARIEIY